MNLADFGSIAGVVLGLAALVTAVRQGRRSFRAETRATVYLEILEIAERRSSYVQSMSARHSARPGGGRNEPGARSDGAPTAQRSAALKGPARLRITCGAYCLG